MPAILYKVSLSHYELSLSGDIHSLRRAGIEQGANGFPDETEKVEIDR
jgi:hypothetical protein